ncbi:coiled-coil domain-containing protein 28B isoform X2 [Brachyhypopomus gauderio]|uniref:coiled-coil domain-containing protein 28B isoform X2 n=1 Tax=Brachyhypopomus gauderio TaxID=698409 RepID=UPI0040414525
MDRQEWLKHLICFQARCRGCLTRKDLKLVQTEFEDVVKELEGCLDHLSWKGTLIPTPNFTDNESTLYKYRRPKIQMRGEEILNEQVEESEKCLSHTVVLVPERDEEPCTSPQRDRSPTTLPPGGDRDGDWSCTAVEMSCNNLQLKSHQRRCRVQDVAHTPEALKQHRNTLAMELLWIQQAIVSRKKYLTLRQKMGVT